MNFEELDKKTVKELKHLLSEERSRLHGLRLKLAVNQLKNVRDVRQTRQTIARILTKLTQLEQKEVSR